MTVKELAQGRAAAMAAYALGAMADPIDKPGAGDNLRDYDLVFPDGRREPLEVTTDAHTVTRKSWARMSEGPFPAPELERLWLFAPDPYTLDASGEPAPIDVLRIRREAPRSFRVLEAADLERLDESLLYAGDPKISAAARALRALGIRLAVSSPPPPDDARLWIAAGWGGAVAVDSIADAIERQASDEGNQTKLDVPGEPAHRHLVVMLDSSSGDLAPVALRKVLEGDERLPRLPRLPQLPPPITTAWAVVTAGALFVTPPGPWRVRLAPEGFRDGYAEWLVPRR